MSKVMLVEDDNNLREIYEARLSAEGYEIISASDGEAALALAIKERPDLIISDIMMPRVSGFDMLDILKSTTETKNIKVIMMTALSQAEDKTKAEELGANIYLVKSQVTLEDVVRSVKQLLGEETPLSIGGIPVHAPEEVNSNNATNTTTSLVSNAPTVPTTSPAPNVPKTDEKPNNNQSDENQNNNNQTQPPTEPPKQAPPTPQSDTPITTPESSSSATATPQATSTSTETIPEPPKQAPTSTPAVQPASPQPTNANATNEQNPNPPVNTQEIASALSTASEEAMLKKQIEQFISEDPATNTSNQTTDATPQQPPAPDAEPTPPPAQPPTPVTESTPAEPAQVPANVAKENPVQPQVQAPEPITNLPVATPQTNNTPQTNETTNSNTAPVSTTPSSMAEPPSSLKANEVDRGDPTEDRPAGEQILAKNATDDASQSNAGIDASVSGRKKVINPINDISRKPTISTSLIDSESGSSDGQPQLNSVITPDGITLANNAGAPSMNDIIVPTVSPTQNQAQIAPEQPLPPPVA